MIETLLSKIGAALVGTIVFLTGVFSPQVPEQLGVALPSGSALFETSLAAPISNSATTMTITANSVRGGGSLSGYQCFTVDEGSAQAEYVCGTVAATTVTSLERGISPADGVTEDADLKFTHRRGASVKITDFPLIQRLASQNSGSSTFAVPIKYATSVSTTTLSSDGQNIASVAYANSLSFGAVAASNETTGGFVELATGLEAASSTLSGSVTRLALPASIATSTSPTSGNVIPVTLSDGNISTSFFPDTLGSSTIRVYTSATDAWTKPATTTGLKYITIWVCGAGGNGSAGGASNSDSGGGGGGGGCGYEMLSATELAATSSVAIAVGTTAGASSSFSTFCTATGGSNGIVSAGSVSGGAEGTATGCDLNLSGGTGRNGEDSASGNVGMGGDGGNSFFGQGGYGGTSNGGAGGAGKTYGGGGGGGGADDNSTATGGSFAQGVVTVTEYY